ncbi:MAG: autotransporter-associated beta strand repeat-containing protein, partial [Fimbriiglobus sp.]
GGAIFVRQGATVTITGGGISGGTATGGTGSGGGGANGQGIGTGLFLAGSATVTVTSGTVTIADTIGGGTNDQIDGGFTKSGSGELALSGVNSYTGATTVNAGTLSLGVSGALSTKTNLVLNGGTLGLTNGTVNTTVSTLDVDAASVINFNTPTATTTLAFGNSSAVAWGGMLTVNGWNGSLTGGGMSQLRVGTDATGLTATQLGQITFAGFGSGAVMLASGELVPVPEPATMFGLAAAGLGAVGWVRRLRRK